jgi:carbon storage regulator
MLILSRKRNQKILIFVENVGVIEVMVTEIRGDKVRLGVKAPKNIPVHREEVVQRLQ